MKALHPSNISNLLFNIPIYQRLFTWGNKQIEELLDDLLIECMSSNCQANYYIGVLTVKHSISSNRIDLVDGQQRLTLMMLMGCVMKKYYEEWGNCFLKYKNELRLDFCARPNDRIYLNYLIGGIDGIPSPVSINKTMEKGYEFIENYLSNNFNAHCEKLSEKLNSNSGNNPVSEVSFCKYVYEHLSFFLSYLPDDYNARMLNKHFESMNSTGRNLENHEILKVRLLRDLSAEEYSQCVSWWNQASRMEQNICPLSDPDKKNEHIGIILKAQGNIPDNKQENETKPESKTIKELLNKDITGAQTATNNDNVSIFKPFLNFTDYILQVLYLKLDADIQNVIVYQHFFNPNKLITTCTKYVGKDKKITPYDFIKDIYRYRYFFDYFILRIDGNGSYRLLSSESSEHDKLEQYQAMLYADSSRYTYYRWIPFILNYVSNKENNNEKKLRNDSILSELKKHDSSISEHQMPNTEFSYNTFNNYFFRRLDYYLWELFIDNKYPECLDKILPNVTEIEEVGIRAIKDYRFHQYNSVEHFHPRSETEQIDIWNDDNAKNAFGNLALISQSFNSTQNDDPLSLKFSRVRDQIDKNKLESIKLALMYYSANKEYTNWTIELMRDHGKSMLDILTKSYPND